MTSTGRASGHEHPSNEPVGTLALGTTHRATFALLAAMFAYLCLHRLALSEQVGAGALHDSGWLSWFTMALQATTLALIATLVPRAPTARGRVALLVLSYIALIYLLREADFHRLFTDEHVTRGRFYLDADIPLAQRLVAGVIVLPVFVCMFAMLVRYALPLLRALGAGRAWAVALVLWGIALVGSQVADQRLDGYTGKLVEEGLEATAAGLALVTVLHARARPDLVLGTTERRRSR